MKVDKVNIHKNIIGQYSIVLFEVLKWVKTSWTYSKLRAINNLLHGFLVLLAVGAPAVLVQHVNRHLRQVEPRPR